MKTKQSNQNDNVDSFSFISDELKEEFSNVIISVDDVIIRVLH